MGEQYLFAKRAHLFSFFYPLMIWQLVVLVLTGVELHREDLAGDEVMVHGIDCTSVSPWTRSFHGFGAR